MPDPESTTLTDDEIETHIATPFAQADTGDDTGDVADTTDTGDDTGDTGDTADDTGDVSDTSDTGDDSSAA